MKLVYLLILIVAICIVITYIFIRLENTRKDVNVLQRKFDNLNNLIENKNPEKNVKSDERKKSPKISISKSDSSSLTSSVSEKKSNEPNLFKSLGIPNIFELFNKNSMLNNLNIINPSELNNFIKHPNTINIEQISTSDDESEATSVVLVANEKNNFDLDIDKTEAYIDNDKQIEVYSNSEKTSKNSDTNNDTNLVPPENIDNHVEKEVELNNINLQNEKMLESNPEQDNRANTDIPTETNTDAQQETKSEPINSKQNNKKYTKNYLESLKLNDLKEMAKKHKVNVSTGKKLKNKTELINDLMKF